MIVSMDETANNVMLNAITSPDVNVVNDTLFGECGPSPKPNERHDCTVCNKTFASITLYDTHYYLVHGPNAEEAPKPDKERQSMNAANESVAQTKVAMHKFQCNKCPRSFRTSSAALYHRETEHNVGRRFVCNKCTKVFKHKQLLQRHQLVHSSDRPHPCDTCGASFKVQVYTCNFLLVLTTFLLFFLKICE